MRFRDKRLLLIIGGGIAAYKCLELIRLVRKEGGEVRAIMTKAAKEFVTPLSVASLCGEKVYDDLFDLTDETEIGHIELSRSADVVLVAPATGDLMAKMASGIADNLATTALLATDKPVFIAPAMNVRMWLHPATQRNLATLKGDGIQVIGPDEGDMACGEFGPGRMAGPAAIIEVLARHFSGLDSRLGRGSDLLKGKRALITSGPTFEPIDPVRYIANRSSGKQGIAIARACAALGAETTLVTGPTALDDPIGVRTIHVETAQEMLSACEAALPADIAIFAAAVADWRVSAQANSKIKKVKGGLPNLSLTENPDICRTIGTRKVDRPDLVIGFAAETDNVAEYARRKRAAKGCDWIVANDVSPETGIMGGNNNTVHLITSDGEESWPEMGKAQVGEMLADRIAAHFKEKD